MKLKPAIVTIGRFNPPTIGHYSVFNQMKKFIKSNPDEQLSPMPIVVVINGAKTSENKQVNPLTPDQRIKYMEGSGQADGIKFLEAKNALEAFKKVRDLGFEIRVIAAGEDRADEYGKILTKYFKSETGAEVRRLQMTLKRSGPKNGVAEILDHVDEHLPINMVSSTLARQAVLADEENKFLTITGMHGNPVLGRHMFAAVKKAMSNGA